MENFVNCIKDLIFIMEKWEKGWVLGGKWRSFICIFREIFLVVVLTINCLGLRRFFGGRRLVKGLFK